jgi:hypothetical protein
VELDPAEERRILEHRDLDRLGDPGAPVAVGQRDEEIEVVHHRVRRGERPDEVLLAERVDAVLDADAGVVLRQHGGRDADQPHAAVGGRGGVADGVEHGAASDHDDVGVAVDAVDVDRGADLVHGARLVLDRLAAGDHQRRRGELERVAVGGAVDDDVIGHRGMRVGDALVDHHQQPGAVLGLDHIAQGGVAGIQQAVGELDGIAERDNDFLVDVPESGPDPITSLRNSPHASLIPHSASLGHLGEFGERPAKVHRPPTEVCS